MEVMDTLTDNDGSTHSEWSTVHYETSGREKERLTYYSPTQMAPPATDTSLYGFPAYRTKGLDLLTQSTVGGPYVNFRGETVPIEDYKADGSRNVVVKDFKRHQEHVDNFLSHRLTERVAFRERTTYDRVKLNWAVETRDVSTGELLKEFDHVTDAGTLQAQFNRIGAPNGYNRNRDYTMVASGFVRVFDIHKGNGSRNPEWSALNYFKWGQLRNSSVSNRSTGLQEETATRFAPNGIEEKSVTVTSANGKDIGRRVVSGLWWEENTGNAHGTESRSVIIDGRELEIPQKTEHILDPNGQDLAEVTVGLEHNTITRVLRDKQTGHETGRATWSLTAKASAEMGRTRAGWLIKGLDRMTSDHSRAALSAKSEAPTYEVDGTVSVPIEKIVLTKEGPRLDKTTQSLVLGKVLTEWASDLRTDYDVTSPIQLPKQKLDLREPPGQQVIETYHVDLTPGSPDLNVTENVLEGVTVHGYNKWTYQDFSDYQDMTGRPDLSVHTLVSEEKFAFRPEPVTVTSSTHALLDEFGRKAGTRTTYTSEDDDHQPGEEIVDTVIEKFNEKTRSLVTLEMNQSTGLHTQQLLDGNGYLLKMTTANARWPRVTFNDYERDIHGKPIGRLTATRTYAGYRPHRDNLETLHEAQMALRETNVDGAGDESDWLRYAAMPKALMIAQLPKTTVTRTNVLHIYGRGETPDRSAGSMDVRTFDAVFNENGVRLGEKRLEQKRSVLGRLTESQAGYFRTYFDPRWSMALPLSQKIDIRTGAVVEHYTARWREIDGFEHAGVELHVDNRRDNKDWFDTYTAKDGFIEHRALGAESTTAGMLDCMDISVPAHLANGMEIGSDTYYADASGNMLNQTISWRNVAFDEATQKINVRKDDIAQAAQVAQAAASSAQQTVIYHSETRTYDASGDLERAVTPTDNGRRAREVLITTPEYNPNVRPFVRTSQTYDYTGGARGELLIDSTEEPAAMRVHHKYWWDKAANITASEVDFQFTDPDPAHAARKRDWNLGRHSGLVSLLQTTNGPLTETAHLYHTQGLESGQTVANDYGPAKRFDNYTYHDYHNTPQNPNPVTIQRDGYDLRLFDTHREGMDMMGDEIIEWRGEFEQRIQYERATLRRTQATLHYGSYDPALRSPNAAQNDRPLVTWKFHWNRARPATFGALPFLTPQNLADIQAANSAVTGKTPLLVVEGETAWGDKFTDYTMAGSPLGEPMLSVNADGEKKIVKTWLNGTNMATDALVWASDPGQDILLKQYHAVAVPQYRYLAGAQRSGNGRKIGRAFKGATTVEMQEFNELGNLRSNRVEFFQFIPVGMLKSGLKADGSQALDLDPGATVDAIRYDMNKEWIKDGADTYVWLDKQIERKIFTSERVGTPSGSTPEDRRLFDSDPYVNALQPDWATAAAKLKKVEGYAVHYLAPDEHGVLKTWTSLYAPNKEDELARIDLNTKRFALNFYDRITQLASVDLSMDNAAQMPEPQTVVGIAVTLNPKGTSGPPAERHLRKVFVLDRALKIPITEWRDWNDGGPVAVEEGRYEKIVGGHMQKMTEGRIAGELIPGLQSSLAYGGASFSQLVADIQRGYLPATKMNHVYGDFQKRDPVTHAVTDTYRAVYLRRGGIPFRSDSHVWLPAPVKNYESEFYSQSELVELDLIPDKVRITSLRHDRITPRQHLTILGLPWDDRAKGAPLPYKDYLVVNDLSGFQLEITHGYVDPTVIGNPNYRYPMDLRRRYDIFEPVRTDRNFFRFKSGPGGDPSGLAVFRVANKSMVSYYNQKTKEWYLHGLGNSTTLHMEEGTVDYLVQRGQSRTPLPTHGMSPYDTYMYLKAEAEGHRLHLEERYESKREIKNGRGFLVTTMSGYSANQVGANGFVKPKEIDKPQNITFYTYELAGGPQILLSSIGVAKWAYEYQFNGHLDREAYEHLEKNATTDQWYWQPNRADSWTIKSTFKEFDVRQMTEWLATSPRRIYLSTYDIDNQHVDSKGKKEGQYRLDGTVFREKYMDSDQAVYPTTMWVYSDEFGQPRFATAPDKNRQEALYAYLRTFYSQQLPGHVYTHRIPLDGKHQLTQLNYGDQQILRWPDKLATGVDPKSAVDKINAMSGAVDQTFVLGIGGAVYDMGWIKDPNNRIALENAMRHMAANPNSVLNRRIDQGDRDRVPPQIRYVGPLAPLAPENTPKVFNKFRDWIPFLRDGKAPIKIVIHGLIAAVGLSALMTRSGNAATLDSLQQAAHPIAQAMAHPVAQSAAHVFSGASIAQGALIVLALAALGFAAKSIVHKIREMSTIGDAVKNALRKLGKVGIVLAGLNFAAVVGHAQTVIDLNIFHSNGGVSFDLNTSPGRFAVVLVGIMLLRWLIVSLAYRWSWPSRLLGRRDPRARKKQNLLRLEETEQNFHASHLRIGDLRNMWTSSGRAIPVFAHVLAAGDPDIPQLEDLEHVMTHLQAQGLLNASHVDAALRHVSLNLPTIESGQVYCFYQELLRQVFAPQIRAAFEAIDFNETNMPFRVDSNGRRIYSASQAWINERREHIEKMILSHLSVYLANNPEFVTTGPGAHGMPTILLHRAGSGRHAGPGHRGYENRPGSTWICWTRMEYPGRQSSYMGLARNVYPVPDHDRAYGRACRSQPAD